jgi:hypothetical protein
MDQTVSSRARRRALPALGAALALLCLAPPALAQAQHPPRDTGSMAYPEPVPGSGTTRQAVPIPDTGSMQQPGFPAGTGQAQPARTGGDIGSMQYPSAK